MIPAILASLAFSSSASSVDFHSNIGFGAQRLKNYRSKTLKSVVGEPTTCANVEQFWFKKAVIDNFAPIEEQKYWRGDGQRYWLNKEFWSGPGKSCIMCETASPICVQELQCLSLLVVRGKNRALA